MPGVYGGVEPCAFRKSRTSGGLEDESRRCRHRSSHWAAKDTCKWNARRIWSVGSKISDCHRFEGFVTDCDAPIGQWDYSRVNNNTTICCVRSGAQAAAVDREASRSEHALVIGDQ